MEHYKSRNNDFFHFTNPHDDISDLDSDELQYYDDRSCDFSFYTPSPLPNLQTNDLMNQNDTVTSSMEELGTFDHGELIFQLDKSMKNLSDNLQRKIEGIGTRISRLEDETCKLDEYVEDVKDSVESHHETTHRKLRQMQSILQEVQDGVLFLRDKHEIAETRLQLAKLQDLKKDKSIVAQKQSFKCNLPFIDLNQQPSNTTTLQQPVTYQPTVSQFPEITVQQYHIPPTKQPQNLQFPHFAPSQQFSSFQDPYFSHPFQETPFPSKFHVKYMPEFTSFSTVQTQPSSQEISNVKDPYSRSNYKNTPEAQPLPYALPMASDVEDGSDTEENGDRISVDEIINKITAMGFRRDLVRACVRKLKENESAVNLNAVLDMMMNNKNK